MFKELAQLAQVAEKLAQKCRAVDRDLTAEEVAELTQAIDQVALGQAVDQAVDEYQAQPHKLSQLRVRPGAKQDDLFVTQDETAQLLAALGTITDDDEQTL